MRLIFITVSPTMASMYICICNAITERQVMLSVQQGAVSLQDLQADLGVATSCGCCAETAQEYLPGGRYAGSSSGLAATVSMTADAANDADPIFHEVIVQRA